MYNLEGGTMQLPSEAQELFDVFVSHANRGLLHPEDRNRFYRFVIYCSQANVKLQRTELEELLVKNNFGDEDAKELACVYDHGRDLLKLV